MPYYSSLTVIHFVILRMEIVFLTLQKKWLLSFWKNGLYGTFFFLNAALCFCICRSFRKSIILVALRMWWLTTCKESALNFLTCSTKSEIWSQNSQNMKSKIFTKAHFTSSKVKNSYQLIVALSCALFSGALFVSIKYSFFNFKLDVKNSL